MRGRWKPKPPKWDWRAYLTEEEVKTISEYESLKEKLEALRAHKNLITNRAIQRAKFAAKQKAKP